MILVIGCFIVPTQATSFWLGTPPPEIWSWADNSELEQIETKGVDGGFRFCGTLSQQRQNTVTKQGRSQ